MASTYTFTNLSATTDTTGLTPISTPIGSGILTNWEATSATQGTDTVGVNNQLWVSAIWIPANCTITNIAFLVGSVGGTDKCIVALYDTTGAFLASSTTAASGTTVGTAAHFQVLALTAPYAAKGPARFFVSVATNGTTARLRTVPIDLSNGAFCGIVSQTYGTPATITAPTTFTADQGPAIFLT